MSRPESGDDDDQGSGEPDLAFEAGIRFSTGRPDLVIYVDGIHSSVGWLRERMSDTLSTPSDRIRLIYKGKLLEDSVALWTLLPPGETQPQPDRKGKHKLSLRRIWIHCHQAFTPGAQKAPSTLPQPQGFDRLRDAGFTPDDIAAIRDQFRMGGNHGGGDAGDVQISEERWMDGGPATLHDESDLSDTSVYKEMVICLSAGYFLGALALWVLWEAHTRDLGISKRGRMSLFAGVSNLQLIVVTRQY